MGEPLTLTLGTLNENHQSDWSSLYPLAPQGPITQAKGVCPAGVEDTGEVGFSLGFLLIPLWRELHRKRMEQGL